MLALCTKRAATPVFAWDQKRVRSATILEAIMPKLKTHKGTAKRFRVTKNGKVMRMLAGRTHLRRRKKSSKKSDFRHAVPSEVKYIVKQIRRTAGKSTKN